LNFKGVSTNVGCCKFLIWTDIYLHEEIWEMDYSDVRRDLKETGTCMKVLCPVSSTR
jgi:hypothetical protein